jgi:hypothetical protein
MRLAEIKNIESNDALYEGVITDIMLEEGVKELYAKGKQALGKGAEKLKDAVDAPAQKAWAEVQSRLATAGKDDAIGKLKDFASKHKVAIGTLAILGAGLLFSGDASAADVAQGAAQAADAASGVTPEKVVQYVMQNLVGTQYQGAGGIETFSKEMASQLSAEHGKELTEYVKKLMGQTDDLKAIVNAVNQKVQYYKMAALQAG